MAGISCEILNYISFLFSGDAVGAVPKGLEQKSKAKPKPSLLAAARPMRAILPAPVRLARETNQEQISCGQSFGNSGKK